MGTVSHFLFFVVFLCVWGWVGGLVGVKVVIQSGVGDPEGFSINVSAEAIIKRSTFAVN